jgi:selenocysteine lyase/cysteine desulfurase
MECDFLVCSPYKFYGPHAGVLFARADVMSALDVAKLEPASDEIPERVETGTQNHEGIVGSGAAVEFLASLATGNTRRQRLVRAMSALHARGDALFVKLWEGLSAIDGVRCYGPRPGRPRTPTVSFTVAGVSSAEAAKSLAHDAVFASNGNFYAASVLARLGHTREGMVRAGCACYTTEEEIDRLIEGVRRIAAHMRSPA